MNVERNKIGRSGKKRYRVSHQNNEYHDSKHKLSYGSGLVAADQGRAGKWTVYNFHEGNDVYDTFEEASKEFEERTGMKPPKPVWQKKEEVESR